ncbi:MAG: hypothetical protein RMJ31_02900 [Nitrososphaerota archaeon]|nr:hypothetical protein [Nitrososphaerota archaeon]
MNKEKYLMYLSITYLLLTTSVFTFDAMGRSETLSFTLNHKFSVNEQGFVLIEDVITISNLAETPTQLPNLIVNYPPDYKGHIADIIIKGPTRLTYTILVRNTSTSISISPKEPYSIPSRSDVKVFIKIYLIGLLKFVDTSMYEIIVPSTPSMNVPLKRVYVNISSPLGTEFQGLSGFSYSKGKTYQYWNATFSNIDAERSNFIRAHLRIIDNPNFSILKYPIIEREIVLSPTGSINIIETIKVENLGHSPISKLRLSLLDPNLKSITIVPETTPPLIERSVRELQDGIIDIQSIFRIPLEKGSVLTLKYEYPLPKGFIGVSGNLIDLSIPLTPPVQGVASKFVLKFNLPNGFLIDRYSLIGDGKIEELPKGFVVHRVNASSISEDKVSVVVRLGLVWASSGIMPIASTIFIILLIATLYLEGIKLSGERGRVAVISKYADAFEEKISSIEDILQSLKPFAQISRADVDRVKRDLELINSRSASRIGEAKGELLSKIPEMHDLIAKITNVERGYDRAVRDFINLYERYIIGKVGKEAMGRLIVSHERSIREAAHQLQTLLDAMRRGSKV